MNATMLYTPNTSQPEINEALTDPDLSFLQYSVNGYIEPVPHWYTVEIGGQVQSCVAYCNEEGKLNQLPINYTATAAWHKALKRVTKPDGTRAFPNGLFGADGEPADLLVGNVIVVTGEMSFLLRHLDGDDGEEGGDE
jgi:hypothetical protein